MWTPPFSAYTNRCIIASASHIKKAKLEAAYLDRRQIKLDGEAGAGPWSSPPQEEAQPIHRRNTIVIRAPEASLLILPGKEVVRFLPLDFSGPLLMALILPNIVTFPDRQTLPQLVFYEGELTLRSRKKLKLGRSGRH